MPPPVLLRIAAPDGEPVGPLLVALTDQLRRRGYRVGSASLRPAVLGNPEATVLVLGNGARATIPRATSIEALPALAASLDPQLDLVLLEGYPASKDVRALELLTEGAEAREAGPPALATLDASALEGFVRPDAPEAAALAALVERALLQGGSDIEGRSGADAAIQTSRAFVRPLPARSAPEDSEPAPRPRGLRALAARLTKRDR